MVALGLCDEKASSSVKWFFSSLVKHAFLHQCGFNCPRNLYVIRDLSFLPHLLGIAIPWRSIEISALQSFLGLDPVQWQSCLQSPMLYLDDHNRLQDVGTALLDYRVRMSQSVPTRLKALYSWNMNSWSHPKCSRQDPKMRRIKIAQKRSCFATRNQVGGQPGGSPAPAHFRIAGGLHACYSDEL